MVFTGLSELNFGKAQMTLSLPPTHLAWWLLGMKQGDVEMRMDGFAVGGKIVAPVPFLEGCTS